VLALVLALALVELQLAQLKQRLAPVPLYPVLDQKRQTVMTTMLTWPPLRKTTWWKIQYVLLSLPRAATVACLALVPAVGKQAKAVPTQSAPAPYLRAVEPDDNILRTRTYDITITYDKYYQTPRVFLFGYNEMRKPLSSEEVFQDIMQDYANKTVTFEPHPHQPAAGLHAAIHPCRHAETMKRIIDHVASSGQDVRVDQYLFIFLKYVAARSAICVLH